MSALAGSRASAKAGSPSVTRLTSSTWITASGTAEPGDDRDREDEHLAEVRGEQESDEVADVVADAASLADRLDDRPEVIVGEDDRRRLAGRLGAAAPSRYPRRRA